MKMDFKTLMSKLFGFAAPTYYTWKRQERPIIHLIAKYFSREDLEEFLTTGGIKRLDDLKFQEEYSGNSDFELFKKFLQFSHVEKLDVKKEGNQNKDLVDMLREKDAKIKDLEAKLQSVQRALK
ncbi:MAG: hypothetical protein QG567_195 [Campylobacterota bacterium]|nr:hypothetical protein [Campylobacterota bacterium]